MSILVGEAGKGNDRWPNLLPQHLADLRRSGLTDETITRSGIYSETSPDSIALKLAWESPAKSLGPCMVIPYPDVAGGWSSYLRVKPDNPRVGENGRPVKYEAPKGVPSRAYFTRAAIANLSDPTKPLVFPEGEKKGIAADQHGIPAIALPGVWGWKKGDVLIPDLAGIKWTGRPVRIAFDSDCVENPNVQNAAHAFYKALTDLGAEVLQVLIPPGPLSESGYAKQGLDDYLATDGRTGWEAIEPLATTPLEPPSLQSLSNVGYRPVVTKDKDGNTEVAREAVNLSPIYIQRRLHSLILPSCSTGSAHPTQPRGGCRVREWNRPAPVSPPWRTIGPNRERVG